MRIDRPQVEREGKVLEAARKRVGSWGSSEGATTRKRGGGEDLERWVARRCEGLDRGCGEGCCGQRGLGEVSNLT